MTGTVFDIGYRSYTGVREGRDRALLAVYKDGVRTALGLGRGPRAKVLPWFCLIALNAVGLIMAIVAGAAERMGGPGTAQQAGLPTHADFYGIMSIMLFVFAAVVAPELLCRDRREGVINLYLVRPLTGSDYIIARWTAFLTIMLAAAWLPQAILFLGLSMGDPRPMEYVRAHWIDVPTFLVAGFAMAAYLTTLALLTASFTTRRAYAAVFLVGLVVISAPFTMGVASEIDGPAGQWISMFTLTSIPLHVNDILFGEMSEITAESPSRFLPAWIRVSWYLAATGGAALVLWWRYRRLTP